MMNAFKPTNPVLRKLIGFLLWAVLSAAGLKYLVHASWTLIIIWLSFWIIKEILDYHRKKSSNAQLH